MFTKQDLIDVIEEEGTYENVSFNTQDTLIGYQDGTKYDLGNDTELISSLVDAFVLSQEYADSYENI